MLSGLRGWEGLYRRQAIAQDTSNCCMALVNRDGFM